MKLALVLAVFLTAEGTACAAGGDSAAPSEVVTPATVTLEALTADPQRYVGGTVRVSGTLENAGSNYFTDLRPRLRDDEGHAIAVRPWLPTAVPPGPKRPGVTPPPTLSNYLGKRVDITAIVERGELPKTNERYYLNVQTADVIP
jgi:hypothetical protein